MRRWTKLLLAGVDESDGLSSPFGGRRRTGIAFGAFFRGRRGVLLNSMRDVVACA